MLPLALEDSLWMCCQHTAPTSYSNLLFSQKSISVYSNWFDGNHSIQLANFQNDSELRVHKKERYKLLGLTLPLGDAFWLHGDVSLRQRDVDGIDTNRSLFDKTYENFQWVNSRAHISLKISPSLIMGLQLTFSQLKAHIIGNFFLGEDDSTNYSGTLIGITGGALVHFDQVSLALAYASSRQGKITQQGEQRLTGFPGYMEGSGNIDLWTGFSLLGAYRLWIYDTDELTKSTTSAIQKANIDLRGIDPEKDLYMEESLYLGVRWAPADRLSLHIQLQEDTLNGPLSQNQLPGKSNNVPSDNRFKAYSAWAKLGVGNEKAWLGFFGQVGNRKKTITIGSNDFGYTNAQWHYGLQFNLGLS